MHVLFYCCCSSSCCCFFTCKILFHQGHLQQSAWWGMRAPVLAPLSDHHRILQPHISPSPLQHPPRYCCHLSVRPHQNWTLLPELLSGHLLPKASEQASSTRRRWDSTFWYWRCNRECCWWGQCQRSRKWWFRSEASTYGWRWVETHAYSSSNVTLVLNLEHLCYWL